MIDDFEGKTAALTGAASGFGLECARIAPKLFGMNLVLVDVQQDALDARAAEMRAGRCTGAGAATGCVLVAEAVEALAQVVQQFASARLISSSTTPASARAAWWRTASPTGSGRWASLCGAWCTGCSFTPMMLAVAKATWCGAATSSIPPAWWGLLTPPNMGIYNVNKHAVVALTETLYQDLRLVTDQVGASVLRPYFVPTGIHQSERNRPGELAGGKPTRSQPTATR